MVRHARNHHRAPPFNTHTHTHARACVRHEMLISTTSRRQKEKGDFFCLETAGDPINSPASLSRLAAPQSRLPPDQCRNEAEGSPGVLQLLLPPPPPLSPSLCSHGTALRQSFTRCADHHHHIRRSFALPARPDVTHR